MYADAESVGEEVGAFLRRFLASDDAVGAMRPDSGLGELAILELHVTDPEARFWIDLGDRRLLDRRPSSEPGAVATIAADALHHLLLDHLGPIEISRLAEEGLIDLQGPPLALAALLAAAGRIQPHYRASLEERGREHLLAAPAPTVGEVWESEHPPPLMFGVARPWQRERASAVEPS